MKKSFHKLFPRISIAVLPTLEKFFHHCPENFKNFFENPPVFKTSIRKNSSISVPLDTSKVFLTTLPKHFPAKTQVSLVKNQKRRKTNCSTVFFWRFYICTLRLLFQHTWLSFLPKSEKTHWKSKRDDNSEKYFDHFFSKFCWGHVKWKLATCRNFLLKYGNFRSETKNDQRITLLSKRASEQSAARVGCSFEKFDKKFTPKIQ